MCETRKGKEILRLLRQKLHEELNEFQHAVAKKDILEDLGDLVEVIEAYQYYSQKYKY